MKSTERRERKGKKDIGLKRGNGVKKGHGVKKQPGVKKEHGFRRNEHKVRKDQKGRKDSGDKKPFMKRKEFGERKEQKGGKDFGERRPLMKRKELVDKEDPEDTEEQGEKREQKEKKDHGDRKEQREKKKFDFERNNRTIFIGNLPSTYDHRDVAKLFKPCGPVESARIRSVIPEKEKLPPKVAQITKRIHPKIDSVNAYLVFEKSDDNEEHIKKALAMNGKLIDEHHIRVDRAQHPNSKRMTLTSRKKSVFVGNLRFDIRDDDLIKHFEKIGPVDYVRLVRDKATGLGKGFGFVKFHERAPVKQAIELNDTQFQGRSLRVKKIDATCNL